ncbi:hypothetical protein Slin15195_G054100 [Septoria linicola]|uniref:Uncharacterized protein n=1 Tax=Septoria linicola TaxID=215465 RepID=A0A9Q9AWS6_9PEZI|nr:hypothetical protein Slin14017_G124900 [Septoria linicola]USW52091.1 hypothetical protein Slin15195_G054100 [Septoria linicola]
MASKTAAATAAPSIKQTPQQIAQSVSRENGTSCGAANVSVAILVHSEEHEVLLHDNFVHGSDTASSPVLNIEHIPNQQIDLLPAARDENADVSIKAITQDALTSMLGPVEIEDLTLLHTASQTVAQEIAVLVFVACRINSAEVPNMCTSDMEWLPESVLQQADLRAMVALLGAEGIANLLGAREAWKEQVEALDDLPELVSTDSPFVAAADGKGHGGRSVSGSSTDDDDVEEIIRDDPRDSRVKIEQQDGVLNLEGLNDMLGGKPFGGADFNNGDKFISGRATLPRGDIGRPTPKQKKELLWVDPKSHWEGPRFAIPAKKVDGRRYKTRVGKTKISLATDKALVEGKAMWWKLTGQEEKMKEEENRLVLWN